MSDTLFDGVVFDEHPILVPSESLSEDDSDYGISAGNFLQGRACPIDLNFMGITTGEFSQRYYSLGLLNKIAELSTSQIDEFLDYQLGKVFDKKRWLLKLEKLIEVGNTDVGLNLYYKNLDHTFEPLRNRISKYGRRSKKRSPPPSTVEFPSFTYKQLASNSHKIAYFYNSLKKNNFISSDTTKANFIKVFSGLKIQKPISWTGNKSELAYLIKLLHNNYALVIDLKQKQWKVTAKCFVKVDGANFHYTEFRELKVPGSANVLDLAVRDLI